MTYVVWVFDPKEGSQGRFRVSKRLRPQMNICSMGFDPKERLLPLYGCRPMDLSEEELRQSEAVTKNKYPEGNPT